MFELRCAGRDSRGQYTMYGVEISALWISIAASVTSVASTYTPNSLRLDERPAMTAVRVGAPAARARHVTFRRAARLYETDLSITDLSIIERMAR